MCWSAFPLSFVIFAKLRTEENWYDIGLYDYQSKNTNCNVSSWVKNASSGSNVSDSVASSEGFLTQKKDGVRTTNHNFQAQYKQDGRLPPA